MTSVRAPNVFYPKKLYPKHDKYKISEGVARMRRLIFKKIEEQGGFQG
jgi:hypothetical protein